MYIFNKKKAAFLPFFLFFFLITKGCGPVSQGNKEGCCQGDTAPQKTCEKKNPQGASGC